MFSTTMKGRGKCRPSFEGLLRKFQGLLNVPQGVLGSRKGSWEFCFVQMVVLRGPLQSLKGVQIVVLGGEVKEQ